jgi:hypothetical protein
MTHKINFPIGDWSDDGHGKCDWFLVESNKDVLAVREAHFQCPQILGFDIGDICSEYEVRALDKKIHAKLVEEGIFRNRHFEDEYEGEYEMSPESLMNLWTDILMYIDPELHLEICKPHDCIHFYGFDDKKRHLSTPGYGLYE